MKEHEEELLLSAYLDEELSQEERARVESHLSSCESCRFELESLRFTKRVLAQAPRRALPPELIADLEARLSQRSWPSRVGAWLRLPRVWVPAGALATAAVALALWLGAGRSEPDQYIPLEPLLAAHSRYTAESLVPQGSLVASAYSSQLTAYYAEPQDQESE